MASTTRQKRRLRAYPGARSCRERSACCAAARYCWRSRWQCPNSSASCASSKNRAQYGTSSPGRAVSRARSARTSEAVAGPHLAEHAVPPRLDGVQQRLHDGRGRRAHALLGDPRQLHGLPAVPQIDGLPAHRHQHVRAVRPVPRRLRRAAAPGRSTAGRARARRCRTRSSPPAGSGRRRRRTGGARSARRRCRAASAPARAPGSARGPAGRGRRRTRRRGCGTVRRPSAARRCRPR